MPLNLRPSGSGTSTMSRGIEIIETVCADRVERGDDHRVGQVRVPADAGVHADEQHVLAGNRGRGRGRGRDARRARDLRRQRDLRVRHCRRRRRRIPCAGRRGLDRDDLVGRLARRLGRVRGEARGGRRGRSRGAPSAGRRPGRAAGTGRRSGSTRCAAARHTSRSAWRPNRTTTVAGSRAMPSSRVVGIRSSPPPMTRSVTSVGTPNSAARRRRPGGEMAEAREQRVEEGVEVTGPPARRDGRVALRRGAHVGAD